MNNAQAQLNAMKLWSPQRLARMAPKGNTGPARINLRRKRWPVKFTVRGTSVRDTIKVDTFDPFFFSRLQTDPLLAKEGMSPQLYVKLYEAHRRLVRTETVWITPTHGNFGEAK